MRSMQAEGVRTPSLLELFTGFAMLGLRAFGGMAAHAHYFFVIQTKWLDEGEFAELYGISQALPGGNVTGMAVVIGDRAHGPLGALVCAAALTVPPTILVIVCAALLALVARNPATIAIESGVVWGAAALMMATGLRTLYGVLRTQRDTLARSVPVLIAAATAALAVSGRFALPLIVVVMVAVTFAWEWRRR